MKTLYFYWTIEGQWADLNVGQGKLADGQGKYE